MWTAWAPDRPEPVVLKREAHLGTGRGPGGPADSLRAEADVLARVHHPGVVELLGVVDDPPGVALVLAHLPGGSLRHLLVERGTLPAGELAAVVLEVAAATAALARAGLVHGDLKPDHVCFDATGRPVVVDLGSAWALRASEADSGRRPRSATPAYLDPAVADGAAPGPRSEVFSLGVVAYEALTGRLPHRGDPAHAVAAAAAGAHRALRTWPAVPPAVAEVVERALAPDPADRPSDPEAFAADLCAAVPACEVVLPRPARVVDLDASSSPRPASTTLRFGPAPPPPVPRRRAHRSRTALLAAAGVGVGIAVVASGTGALVRTDPPVAGGGGAGRPAPCPAILPSPPPGAVLHGDLDGDGCDDVARWDGRTLVVATAPGSAAYRIDGSVGHLLLGDWDGDGTDAPALYDPASGRARLYDRLPEVVGRGLGPSRVIDLPAGGRPELVAGGSSAGVDTIRVVRP